MFVDSDNAYGSPRGDVDDAFALSALFAARAPLAALSSCAGNTSEERAYANNARLAAMFGVEVPLFRAAEARERLRDFTGRVLALGPMTNVAHARRASEIILVGGGRWPFDLNLMYDRAATRAVLALDAPLTVFPLRVAGQLSIVEAEVPEFLREGTRRWFRHLLLTRFTRRFAVYDLAAALYALGEEGFAFETNARGKVCTALDRDLLWRRFQSLLPAARGEGGA